MRLDFVLERGYSFLFQILHQAKSTSSVLVFLLSPGKLKSINRSGENTIAVNEHRDSCNVFNRSRQQGSKEVQHNDTNQLYYV